MQYRFIINGQYFGRVRRSCDYQNANFATVLDFYLLGVDIHEFIKFPLDNIALNTQERQRQLEGWRRHNDYLSHYRHLKK